MPRPSLLRSRVPTGLALLLLAGAGCQRERPAEPADAPADTTGAEIVVPLHGLALRVEPSAESPGAYDVAVGTPLRLLESRGGWLRLATWDDRAGWAEEPETMELPLWVHYQQALGGAPLSDLRPGYPLGDGRWGVEAPPPSPGVVTSASVWVLGLPSALGSVSSVENVASSCGRPHRMALLAEPPPGGRAGRGGTPILEAARLVTTAAPSPTLRALEPRPATPDPARALAVGRMVDSLFAAPGGGDPGRPTRYAPTEWLALGEDALWVTLAARVESHAPPGSWGAAAVVFGGGDAPEIRLVVPPYPAPGPIPSVRPVLAYSTAGEGRPTLFIVDRLDSGGRRIELYVARGADVRWFYGGFPWGC